MWRFLLLFYYMFESFHNKKFFSNLPVDVALEVFILYKHAEIYLVES